MGTSNGIWRGKEGYIAHQCPLSSGPGVYLARSLYALGVDTTFDDAELCAQAGIQLRAAQSALQGALQLVPNPAEGQCTAYWPNPEKVRGELCIFDLLGRKLFAKSFEVGVSQLELDTEALPAGLCLFRVRLENGTAYSGKCVIIHP